MAIKKFRPQSPDNDLGKVEGDSALAKLGHLNRLVDDINNLPVPEFVDNTPSGKVDLRTVGPRVYFEKKDGFPAVDVIIPGVLEITRGNDGGIYNAALQNNWNGSGPQNTQWNSYYTLGPQHNGRAEFYGWHNLLNFYDRPTSDWINAVDNRAIKCLDQELIMTEVTTGRVWLVKFLKWSVGAWGGQGGFAYERYEVFPKVVFERPANSPQIVDKISDGVIIKRDNQRGIYNAAVEPRYDDNAYTSPAKTLWNSQAIDGRINMYGWNALVTVKGRLYDYWNDAVDANPPDSVGYELIMKDLTTGLYYKIVFTNWGVGNAGGQGAVSYERTLIPMDHSIDYADKTYADSAKSLVINNLPVFGDHTAAVAEFTTANGYITGKVYFYLNQDTNAVGFVEVNNF